MSSVQPSLRDNFAREPAQPYRLPDDQIPLSNWYLDGFRSRFSSNLEDFVWIIVVAVFCDSTVNVFAPAGPLEFPHKSCDKSFRDSRKHLAISVPLKSAPDSNPRCTNWKLFVRFFRWSAISSHAFVVFQQTSRRVHFDTPYTLIASNSAPALVLSYLLLVQGSQLSLCCSFRLTLIYYVYRFQGEMFCFFHNNFLSRKSSLLFQSLSVAFLSWTYN